MYDKVEKLHSAIDGECNTISPSVMNTAFSGTENPALKSGGNEMNPAACNQRGVQVERHVQTSFAAFRPTCLEAWTVARYDCTPNGGPTL
jgi:hypothetical protein